MVVIVVVVSLSRSGYGSDSSRIDKGTRQRYLEPKRRVRAIYYTVDRPTHSLLEKEHFTLLSCIALIVALCLSSQIRCSGCGILTHSLHEIARYLWKGLLSHTKTPRIWPTFSLYAITVRYTKVGNCEY